MSKGRRESFRSSSSTQEDNVSTIAWSDRGAPSEVHQLTRVHRVGQRASFRCPATSPRIIPSRAHVRRPVGRCLAPPLPSVLQVLSPRVVPPDHCPSLVCMPTLSVPRCFRQLPPSLFVEASRKPTSSTSLLLLCYLSTPVDKHIKKKSHQLGFLLGKPGVDASNACTVGLLREKLETACLTCTHQTAHQSTLYPQTASSAFLASLAFVVCHLPL